MSFAESERSRQVDPGVILHPAFDKSVRDYFERHDITWWGGGSGPTESPISSQVACVNHLEPARLDPDIALALARSVLPEVTAACEVEDGGFLAYEWIGGENYLHERSRRRGENSTSIDAVMVAEVGDSRTLILIEWKYTERYKRGDSRAFSEKGTDRVAIYRPLLERSDCPIDVPGGDLEALFYDPFEQLMRQTLLGWQMVEAGEFGAGDWRHILVVPAENRDLRDTNTSPRIPGSNLTDAWRSVLKEPERFRTITPTELLGNVDGGDRWREWREWLGRRYGT